MQDVDVVIIGLGPVGATLANLLGSIPINTLVLEREAATYPLPRAVHFDDEVMRVFQTVGIAHELSEKVRVNAGMRFVDKAGELLLDWPRPAKISEQGWHPSYRFHQPDLEFLLREQLASHSSVDVRLHAEVLRIETADDHCVVDWDQRGSNASDSTERSASEGYSSECKSSKGNTINVDDQYAESVRAKYVIGCDGANSIIRRGLDVQWQDFGFNERWLVVDVLLKRERPELGDFTVQHCDPDRPSTYARSPMNRRRWEFALKDSEAPEAMQDEESVWSLLSRWITPADADIERRAVYSFQSTLAESWYQNRCFLAGDAAHLTPPFMGQGMCCGIRDASNLAWKLAHCIKHGHDVPVIKSYQQERKAHTRYYIETAMSLGKLINSAGSKESLQSALLNADGTARMKSIKPRLGDGLSAGHTEHAGYLFAQLNILGQKMDDVIGYKSVLLIDDEFLNDHNELIDTVDCDDCMVLSSQSDKSITDVLITMQAKSVWIRPDRYVLGTASNDTELHTLLCSFK